MAALRRSVPPERAAAAGRAVAGHVMASPEMARARRAALYASLPDELPTRPLFEALRAAGRTVLLPRLLPDDRLVFAVAEAWETLRAGGAGVLEPGGPAVTLAADDVVCVPGVAFDAAGHRLGRGGGHYDRVFAEPDGPFRFGLAYAFQLVPALPRAAHDRPVDAVVTESGIHRPASPGRGA